MATIITGAVVGKTLSLLVDKVLESVKLLAGGDGRFRGLQSLLSRLREPVDYLVIHEDEAEETLVRQWLEDLRKELAKAEALVAKWPTIKRWDLRRKHHALKKLIRITENLQHLDNSQTVSFASNSRTCSRLGQGMDSLGQGMERLGEGVDRVNEEVKACVECLTSEVRSLIAERREFAQATEDVVARDERRIFPQEIEQIKRKMLGARDKANVEAGSGSSGSSELVAHFDATEAREAFPDEVFGGNDILDKIVAEILHDSDHHKCIGLWNMGGAGKTFTAGRVFHDPRIQTYFHGVQHRLWVTVSKRNAYSVMSKIFQNLAGPMCTFPAADDLYSVRRELKRVLNLGKFLLVIDDVWEADQLDFLDLISGANDSKRVVLVTTRLQEILDKKHATKIEVPLLAEDDSWNLFSRNAFGRAMVPSRLRDVSKSVVAECRGLPLALKVIGSTLAGETKSWVWENSLKKLRYALVLGKDHEIQVFGRLQLSVDNLRDRDESDSRLQHCFYYFAAFPEDDSIDPQELAALWIAEGIVGKDVDSPISPESEAYELLGTLIALSMIEVEKTYKGSVKIHDVMRDLARFNLENKFGKGFSVTEKVAACQRLCLYRAGLGLETFPKDWITGQGVEATTPMTLWVERLSFVHNQLQMLPERFTAPRLQVLLLQGNRFVTSLSATFFQSFTSLRILHLGKLRIEEIPEAVFDLISLVYLNLESCGHLQKLPTSIGRLQNLQQLYLDECTSLRSAPRSLTSLTSLKVLNADNTFMWDGPESLGEDEFFWERLESSEEDDDFQSVSEDGGFESMSEDDDTQSECLRENDGLKYSTDNIASLRDVVLLKSLQSLSISSISSSPVAELSQLIDLESLSLECPKWKKLPRNLTKWVSLKRLSIYCSLVELPALDKLQHLEKLHVRCDGLRRIPDSFGASGAFPSLHSLRLVCPKARGPMLQPGAMPQLESFTIQKADLGNMGLAPSLQALNGLIYLEISNCESVEYVSAFGMPNSLPHLKELSFSFSSSLKSLPAGILKAAPDLRWMDLCGTQVKRSDIPEDLLEKERLKQLDIRMDRQTLKVRMM